MKASFFEEGSCAMFARAPSLATYCRVAVGCPTPSPTSPTGLEEVFFFYSDAISFEKKTYCTPLPNTVNFNFFIQFIFNKLTVVQSFLDRHNLLYQQKQVFFFISKGTTQTRSSIKDHNGGYRETVILVLEKGWKSQKEHSQSHQDGKEKKERQGAPKNQM